MSTTTFIKRILGPTQSVDAHSPALTLRYAVPADADALARLAELDSQRAPRGVVLVAEVGGAVWAAISLDDHHAIADPFRPTGELVALLHRACAAAAPLRARPPARAAARLAGDGLRSRRHELISGDGEAFRPVPCCQTRTRGSRNFRREASCC